MLTEETCHVDAYQPCNAQKQILKGHTRILAAQTVYKHLSTV